MTEKRKSVSLSRSVMTSFLLVTAITLFVVMFIAVQFSIYNARQNLDAAIETSAVAIANDPRVSRMLETRTVDEVLHDHLNRMISTSRTYQVITIADMNSIRYFHPDKAYIGRPFIGDDQIRVIKNGDVYFSDATGTLGPQHRFFTPVYGSDGEQVGFVMVAVLQTFITETRHQIIEMFLCIGVILMVIAAGVAMALSSNILNRLLGHEPEQLTQLFTEREDLFSALEEGVLSVNQKEEIVLANRAAQKMLGVKGLPLIGCPVAAVLPSLLLQDTLKEGNSTYNYQLEPPHAAILCDKLPIRHGDKIAGAVIILRDRAEAIHLAEQLTGSTHIIRTLRAHTHEFMNHLHVILGLLEMELLTDAIDYIRDIARMQTETVTPVFRNVENPTVAALILSKSSHMREQQIEMSILMLSTIPKKSRFLSSQQQVTIIGNLLENAMEAIIANRDEYAARQIQLCMEEGDSGLVIAVSDTGIGIAGDPYAIFRAGYSTKGAERGTGMAVVYEIVQSCNGNINIDSEPGEGTCITIIIDQPRDGFAAN